MIVSASKPKSGTLGVFGQPQDALDTIWNVEQPKTAGLSGRAAAWPPHSR